MVSVLFISAKKNFFVFLWKSMIYGVIYLSLHILIFIRNEIKNVLRSSGCWHIGVIED